MQVSRRRALQLTGAAAAAGLVSGGAATASVPLAVAAGTTLADVEPNVDKAMTWWDRQRQVWTPIGWKAHLFRFDVFYNGTMVCQPYLALPPSQEPTLKPWLEPYERDGKNFQVTVVMPNRGTIPAMPTSRYYMHRGDFGVGIQGWQQDKKTPVLWTDHRRQEGVVIRQSVFGHLRGAPDVQTGFEPIYAWMRFSVEHVNEVRAPASFAFVLRLSKAFIKHVVDPVQKQEAFLTMEVKPAEAPLGTTLRIEQVFNPGPEPVPARIYDADNKVRMAVSVPGATTLTAANGVYDLKVVIAARKGAHVDVLVPMLSQPPSEIDAELALGYDGALAQAEAYWSRTPSTASAT